MSHVSYMTKLGLSKTKFSFCTIGRGDDIMLFIQSLRHPALSLHWLIIKKVSMLRDHFIVCATNKELFLSLL